MPTRRGVSELRRIRRAPPAAISGPAFDGSDVVRHWSTAAKQSHMIGSTSMTARASVTPPPATRDHHSEVPAAPRPGPAGSVTPSGWYRTPPASDHATAVAMPALRVTGASVDIGCCRRRHRVRATHAALGAGSGCRGGGVCGKMGAWLPRGGFGDGCCVSVHPGVDDCRAVRPGHRAVGRVRSRCSVRASISRMLR